MPHIGQAKGGFNRPQQRIVGVKPRVLNATHPVVCDGDEHHSKVGMCLMRDEVVAKP